jgi:hypothetical protein
MGNEGVDGRMDRQNVEPAASGVAERMPTYKPDDGFGALAFGVGLLVGMTAWAFVTRDPVAHAIQGAGGLAGLMGLVIGLKRRRVHRAVGGAWPPLTGPEPAEPLRFLSGDASKDLMSAGAPFREPWLMIAFAWGCVPLGASFPFVLPAGEPAGVVVAAACGGVFVLLGLSLVVMGLLRARWMSRYRTVVGHRPW